MADVFTSLIGDVIGIVYTLEPIFAIYGLYCVYKYFNGKRR